MKGTRFRSNSNGHSSFSSTEGENSGELEELMKEIRESRLSEDSPGSSPCQELEEKIFLAVGKDHEESKSLLMWALKNFPGSKKFVLVHVHSPDKTVPMSGKNFPACKLSQKQVPPHRRRDGAEMNETLSQYLDICASRKVEAETLVIEMEDAASGLLALIHDHGITDLVMGTGNYSRSMKSPQSRTAKTLHEKAPSYCRIYSVREEKISSIRQADIRHSKCSLSPASASSVTGTISEEAEALLQALEETWSARTEAYIESRLRIIAEDDAFRAADRVMILSTMHEREYERRIMAEAALETAREEIDKLKAEALQMKSDFEAKLDSLEQRITFLNDKNQVFSYEEIDQATRGFNSSLKIGEGGNGAVYKGTLRDTTVAIKRLHSHGTLSQNEFLQEVEVLRTVKHPNLVTLIGVCPEACCLVYEYLPNGSLEDRLACKDNSAPLSWQYRLRIAADICSALIFLHSSKSHSIAHGDLKPANVFLDDSFRAKLGGLELSRALSHHSSGCSTSSSSIFCYPVDTPQCITEYMDPEILVTGELTIDSDVYSFGVIVLRLLTGRPPESLIGDVAEAVENNAAFPRMLDRSAGNWPFGQAEQLAHLALQCCAVTRTTRPDLSQGVRRIIWRMLDVSISRPVSPPPLLRPSDDDSHAPSQYLCPIFLEIMVDPQIAVDGYTYEGKAIRAWFRSGHRTSPLTNLGLRHRHLIPNHSLRSIIQEWLHLQQRQQHL